MAYRNKKTKRKQPRYHLYFEKLKIESQRNELRLDFLDVLRKISDQRCDEYWECTKKLLQDMYDELTLLGEPPSIKEPVNVIHYCIKIFDIASRYQDSLNGAIVTVPEEKAEEMRIFNNDLYFCGRHEKNDLRTDSHNMKVPYWNTTQKGQEITLDNIMFGPDIGFAQRPASYWIKLSKKKKIETVRVVSSIYGKISAPGKSIWQTQALVNSGIQKFCKTAHQSLLEDIEGLLA